MSMCKTSLKPGNVEGSSTHLRAEVGCLWPVQKPLLVMSCLFWLGRPAMRPISLTLEVQDEALQRKLRWSYESYRHTLTGLPKVAEVHCSTHRDGCFSAQTCLLHHSSPLTSTMEPPLPDEAVGTAAEAWGYLSHLRIAPTSRTLGAAVSTRVISCERQLYLFYFVCSPFLSCSLLCSYPR